MSVKETNGGQDSRERKQGAWAEQDLHKIIDQAAIEKERGNNLFGKGDYGGACINYKKVITMLQGSEALEDPDTELKSLLQACRLNVAACKMKMNEWKEAEQYCSKVLALNTDAVEAWYRRGECNFQLMEWTSAKSDFQQVLVLEPKNKIAKDKIVKCKKKMLQEYHHEELSGEPGNARIGGNAPRFHEEYVKRFGSDGFLQFLHLCSSFAMLDSLGNQSINETVKEEISSKTDQNMWMKRWGNYLTAGLSEDLAFGAIVPFNESNKYRAGRKDRFQTMKNCKIIPRVLETGKTHVSLGCADFAQLLFGNYLGDSKEVTQFYGFDFSLVSIMRCKLLYRMLQDNASARSVLQVWFSTGWSKSTLNDFLKTSRALLEDGTLANCEENIVKYWIKNKVTLKAAVKGWTKGLEEGACYSSLELEPCANLKSEIDRVEYARYILTGYIFEEGEASLDCGNRTMFAVPPSLGVSKKTGENFYNTLDVQVMIKFGFEYINSLKISTDKFMIDKMKMVLNMVRQDRLRMTFHTGTVSPDNMALLNEIRGLNPYTIDWSNLPDYFSKKEFLRMAQSSSGEETVHYMHLMNWYVRVKGSFILDYPNRQIKGIIKGAYDAWIQVHSMTLRSEPVYRALWSENTIFASIKNFTLYCLAEKYRKKFLDDMFGDVQYHIDLRFPDLIAFNPAVLYGGFTFADLKLGDHMSSS